jgi:hypothetical protein
MFYGAGLEASQEGRYLRCTVRSMALLHGHILPAGFSRKSGTEGMRPEIPLQPGELALAVYGGHES